MGKGLEITVIAEAGLGDVVPEQAVIFARFQKGVYIYNIELKEIDIMALVVHHIILQLAQSVKGFIRRGMKELPDVLGLLLHNCSRCKKDRRHPFPQG